MAAPTRRQKDVKLVEEKGELSLSLKFLLLAAKAANPADDLPDGAAASAAVGITVEEIHLADLLVRFRLARTGGLYRIYGFISSCKSFQQFKWCR